MSAPTIGVLLSLVKNIAQGLSLYAAARIKQKGGYGPTPMQIEAVLTTPLCSEDAAHRWLSELGDMTNHSTRSIESYRTEEP
jgi:hypothetical protein